MPGSHVLIDGNPVTSGGPAAASAVSSISINGAGTYTVNLSQFPSASFTNLSSFTIAGNGGDTLIAPVPSTNVWALSGVNAGSLTLSNGPGGLGSIGFTGVANLTGGDVGDTINLANSGSGITGAFTEEAGGSIAPDGLSISLPGNIGAFDTNGAGLTINGSSSLGTGNSVTFDGNLSTGGGALNVYADTISINTAASNVSLSTRDIAPGGDPSSANSLANSGDINFYGTNITLGSTSGFAGSANLYAQGNNGFLPGDINFTASFEAGQAIGTTGSPSAGFGSFISTSQIDLPLLPQLNDSAAAITLNNSMVMGGTVTFEAAASNYHVDTQLPALLTPTAITTTLPGYLQSFSLLGAAAASISNAQINLGVNSNIDAVDFSATASGTSDSEVSPIAVKVGVAMAIVDTTAEVTAAGHITTSLNTSLVSNAINTVAALADAGGNLAVPGSKNLATVGAAIAVGARIPNRQPRFPAAASSTPA